MRRKIIIAFLTSSFALAGCGIKGNLKTPPPLWGDKKIEQPQPTGTETPEASAPDEIASDNPS